ncbi:hypothetical protein GCM10020360_21370 [Nonlabens tegetincola]
MLQKRVDRPGRVLHLPGIACGVIERRAQGWFCEPGSSFLLCVILLEWQESVSGALPTRPESRPRTIAMPAGVVFVGRDEWAPGSEIGSIDHHALGWDRDLGTGKGPGYTVPDLAA